MRTVNTTLYFNLRELTLAERRRLEERFAEYGSCHLADKQAVSIALPFSYDESDGVFLDPWAYRMIELFLCELGNDFPTLEAIADCSYSHRKENLEKGYDDRGGYWIMELKEGVLYRHETAIN